MSWLREAYTISTPDPDAHYVAVDPGEFYEWRYTGIIPKGTIFTKRLPRSEIFTEGLVIASAVIPPSSLKTKKHGVELTADVNVMPNLEVGQIQSPQELLAKYKDLNNKFSVAVKDFIKSAETRMYFVSLSKEPHLYRLASSNETTAHLENYGPLEDILSKLKTVRTALNQESLNRTGRAYEMEDFRRFENAMTVIENKNHPIDKATVETLISIAKLKPVNAKSSPWSECCVELSPGVREMKDLLGRYHSLRWIRDSLQFS